MRAENGLLLLKGTISFEAVTGSFKCRKEEDQKSDV